MQGQARAPEPPPADAPSPRTGRNKDRRASASAPACRGSWQRSPVARNRARQGSPPRSPSAHRYRRGRHDKAAGRSEEHTSELQSLMRTSYAVFCLKKKKKKKTVIINTEDD